MADTVRTRRSLALGASIALVLSLLVALGVRIATRDTAPVARLGAGKAPADEPGLVPTAADGIALPATELVGFDGSTTTAEALAGTPLVINFWSSTCGPCVTEMPTFQKVHAALGDKVRFLGVNAQDGVDTAKAFAARTGVTYPLWLDRNGATQAVLKVSLLPTTVFVSADGVIRKTTFGALDETKLTAAISAVFGPAVAG
jgi:cytochrome c biogenesis protein CcmG, thiol:disulfide interchange protein DsbE